MTEPTDKRADGGPPLADERGGPAAFEDERSPQARILVGLAKIGLGIRSYAWEAAAPHGLNPTQAQILSLVLRSGPSGSGLTTLAHQLGVKQPTVSDSVAALEKKGLVTKCPDGDDARRLRVKLTKTGRERATALSEWPPELLDTVDRLSEDEQADFLRSLVTVVRTMAGAGQLAPVRACATCRYFEPDAVSPAEGPHYCHFAKAPFGDLNLRLDCLDHRPRDPETS